MYSYSSGANNVAPHTPYSYDHASMAFVPVSASSCNDSLASSFAMGVEGSMEGLSGRRPHTLSPYFSSPVLWAGGGLRYPSSSLVETEALAKPAQGLGLTAILFAEFDNVHGPVVVHQWPEGFVSDAPGNTAKEIGLYGTYLIPHEALSGHACTWTHGVWTYLTYPVTFEDPKFFRNQYRTNLIFVFDAARAEIDPFRSIIRRVSHAFQILEKDFEWLSRQSTTAPLKSLRADADIPPTPNRATAGAADDPSAAAASGASAAGEALIDAAGRQTSATSGDADHAGGAKAHGHSGGGPPADMPPITTVLRRIVEGLNTNHEAVVDLSNGMILSFKYFSPMPAPPEIRPWDVPVLVSVPSDDDFAEMDLALHFVIPRIDNVRSVAVIASILGMPVATCCAAMQHLAYYGVIKIIDIFQNSNIYALVPSPFAAFCISPANSAMLEWTCRYCSRDVNDPISVVALINFFQAFGCHPLDPAVGPGYRTSDVRGGSALGFGGNGNTASSTDAAAALAGLKRVETVLRYFDEFPGTPNVYPSRMGTGASEKAKLEKFRSEWRDELRNKLSVRHAIAFGVFSGFLKRVHEIPVYDSHKASRYPTERRKLQETEEFKPLYDILAGAKGRSIDDICLTLTLTTERAWARADIMAFEKCCNILLK